MEKEPNRSLPIRRLFVHDQVRPLSRPAQARRAGITTCSALRASALLGRAINGEIGPLWRFWRSRGSRGMIEGRVLKRDGFRVRRPKALMMASLSLPQQLRARGVTAVLGPTNTGKTHLAIERMAAHSSGLIGLPLRLLAREVYGRLVEKVGAEAVALITGEEKIKPANPRYWVATVEAMPRDLDVAFVAVDEIQLGMDYDRGHVFTDHLLNRRGREETLVIGSMTMKPLVEQLLPGANIVSRPRLSKLSFAGEKKLTRLPSRSAIVAFSAEEVYAIAEVLRRQRGGAAVVLGALSPRTRNAQVELFQSGDVDYIVATDAIGMGLNLDIHHVAFANDSKFDGHFHRRLTSAEVGQIAGRAGRHLRDGTFGTSGRCRPFDPELIEAVETHSFDPVKLIHWRNPDIDLSSADALRASLAVAPSEPGLARAPRAEDEAIFDIASTLGEVRGMIGSRDGVTKLWEICSLPDYRKVAYHAHAELVGQIFGFIMEKGAVPEDWYGRQLAMCDRVDGDIDTLSARIAQTRTWTFCANRDWLREPLHWQAEARAIEDKLSDALHERLTARFVDRRTSVLMRRLRENSMLEAEVSPSGEVVVEGQPVGRLEGFRFTPEANAGTPEAKALSAAAMKALASEIDSRAEKVSASPDEAFALALDGAIRWQGGVVAKVQASERVLEPRFLILADEQLTGGAREKVDARLALWLKAHVRKLLGPLFTLEEGEGLEGIARGIAYQVAENLGVLDRTVVQGELKTLPQEARAALRKLGVRFGAYHLTVPALQKPAPRALAAQLWLLKHGGVDARGLDDIVHLSSSGRTSIPVDAETPKALYRAAGYRVAGPRAIRVDILERLADIIRPAIAFRPGQTPGAPPPGSYSGDGFTVTGAMTSLAGCAGEDFAAVLKSLGYRMEKRPPLPPFEIVPVVVAAAAPAAAPAGEAPAQAEAPEASETEAAPSDTGATDIEAATEAEAPAEAPAEQAAAPEESAAAPEEPAAEMAAAPEPELAEETPPPPAVMEIALVEADGPTQEPASAAEPAAPAEPEFVEVWRPARFHRDQARRPPRRGRGDRPHQAARPQGGAGEQPPAAVQRADQGAPRRDRRPWRKPEGVESGAGERRPDDRPREGSVESRPARGKPDGRPFGDRNRGEGRRPEAAGGERPERGGRPPRRDEPARGPRQWSSAPPPARDKAPDPDSPFAKLAVLKARLEGRKD
jgi:ATP-dependent RNA helicase SUPV3L1/SUV3